MKAIGKNRWDGILSRYGFSHFLELTALAILFVVLTMVAMFFSASMLMAQDAHFHNAPASSKHLKNPYTGQRAFVATGSKLYAGKCAACHGNAGSGTGSIPALYRGATQSASDGEVFWFITAGSVNDGMPSWAMLPEQERWQIVTYLKSLKNFRLPPRTVSAAVAPIPTNAAPPQSPFTDFRFEEPGKTRKITIEDLPAPYSTDSAGNGPQLVARPRNAWPKAPDGFAVQQYATGLDNPRLIGIS